MGSDGLTHIFSNHLLQNGEINPIPRESPTQVWTSLCLLLCLVLLALIRRRALPAALRTLQSIFTPQAGHQAEREDLNPFRFAPVILNLFFAVNLSFLIYKFNSENNWILQGKPGLHQFSFFFGLVLMYSIFRSLVHRGLILITDERRMIALYMTVSSVINQALGLALFPLVVLSEFTTLNPTIALYVAFGLVAISLILRWYRGLAGSIGAGGIGILQILTYFCGLEILPIAVLVKFVLETFLYKAV